METTQEIVSNLIKALQDNYKTQLSGLPIKKSVAETLLDGFKDGSRQGVWSCLEMLDVKVTRSGE